MNLSITLIVGILSAVVVVWVAKKSDQQKTQEQQLKDAEQRGKDQAKIERMESELKALWGINSEYKAKVEELTNAVTILSGKTETVLEKLAELKDEIKGHQREYHGK